MPQYCSDLRRIPPSASQQRYAATSMCGRWWAGLCATEPMAASVHCSGGGASVPAPAMPAGGSGSQSAYRTAPALSQRGKRHLSQVLKGRHQELMKMLIAEGNVAGAIQYLYLLPPDRQICSCLMKECSAASDIAGLQMAIQVRKQRPVRALGAHARCRHSTAGNLSRNWSPISSQVRTVGQGLVMDTPCAG